MNYECGVLVDGFDQPAMFLMAYNPPYYPRLFEDYGFETAQNLFAFIADRNFRASEKLRFISDSVMDRFQIKIRTMDRARLSDDVDNYFKIYNASMASNGSGANENR